MDYFYDDALTFLSRKRDKYLNNIKLFNPEEVRLLEASLSYLKVVELKQRIQLI